MPHPADASGGVVDDDEEEEEDEEDEEWLPVFKGRDDDSRSRTRSKNRCDSGGDAEPHISHT